MTKESKTPISELPLPSDVIKSSDIWTPQVSDYKKVKEESKNKSFAKEHSLFAPLSEDKSSLSGPHEKRGRLKRKPYHLSVHPSRAYFASEILNEIGINTEKIRVLTNTPRSWIDGSKLPFIGTKTIENYIPMAAVRDDVDSTPKSKYKLDFDKQIIIDRETKEEYKISGNLFAADVAAILIKDADFQPDGNNLGLVRKKNRFYAIAIDKEHASFSGENYATLSLYLHSLSKDKLFTSKRLDQSLAIVNEIARALLIDEKGQCDFERIFCNSRIMAAEELKENCRADYEKLKYSAQSMVNYYEEKHGPDCLKNFSEREQKRILIANKVIEKLGIDISTHKDDIQRIIVEDLRAPYYMHITDETELITAIATDINNEFDIARRSEVVAVPGPLSPKRN